MQVKDRNKNRKSIGVLALVSLLLQLGIAPAVSLASGHPNFALVFAAVVALTIGGDTGVASAFAAGLVYDLATTGPFGLMTLLLPIAAYALGSEVRDRLSDDLALTIVPFSVAALAVSLLYSLAMLLFGASSSFLDVIVFRALPSALLTVIAFLPFVFVLGRGHRGGSLRMGKASRQSRYTMGNR